MTDLSSLSDDQLKSLYAQSQPVDPRTMTDEELKSAYTASAPAPMSWSDVGSQALSNAVPSAEKFASDIAQPFMHPMDTLNNIADLGVGAIEKTGLIPQDQYAKKADAVGQYFANRYGGMDKFKQSLASDPVGVAGDLSTVLTGGETALARAPGILGKLGDVAGTVGRAIDPINAAATAGSIAGQGAARTLGVTTGAGTAPFLHAASAGLEGGQAGEAFRANMRGQAPLEDAVTDARNALRQIRQERGDAYNHGMLGITSDPTILSFDQINQAINRNESLQRYKGQSLSESTEQIRRDMRFAVNQWETFPPQEFHTAEGLDALKKKLGDMRDATDANTPARVAADRIYNAVRQTIVDQAPIYADVMRGYETASNQIKEIERTLSLNPNATIDTALRKLQSTLRDNVNTSFGQRTTLANYLVNAGAPHLMERLAGQSLRSWEPRGLSRLGAMEAGSAGVGLLAHGTTGAGAAMLATLPLTSPRLMGEAVHSAGRLARPLRPPARIARQVSPYARQIGATNPYALNGGQ
jgi:hypothetical protein